MPQNNFWGCKLPDFHLLTGKTPFLRLLEKIQSPYTLLAAFPRTWYNREESHLGQLEFFSGCSFLIALNMILHLRIIPHPHLHLHKKTEQKTSISLLPCLLFFTVWYSPVRTLSLHVIQRIYRLILVLQLEV